jgi:hypothetical protein
MNLSALCDTNLVLSIAEDHVTVLIGLKAETETTYVRVVNAFDHVVNENTWKEGGLFHAFFKFFMLH